MEEASATNARFREVRVFGVIDGVSYEPVRTRLSNVPINNRYYRMNESPDLPRSRRIIILKPGEAL